VKPESTGRIYWNGEMETLGPEQQRAIEEPKLLRQLEYAWRAAESGGTRESIPARSNAPRRS